ncbi:MAG TPA: nuclear transport factor 2 family protein [Acidimicrobiales bacterium]
MAVIDQRLTWRKVEERLATETDPVLRRNLELLLQHMKAEATLDMESLMATVSQNACYHAYGGGHETLVGKPAVRAFYEAFAASGAHKLHLDIDRLVVDRDCILTEGQMRIAYPGRTLAARGIEVDDPDAYYLYETRMAVVWPIDENGLFIGEDSYVAGDGFAGIAQRKIDPADIVLFEGASA